MSAGAPMRPSGIVRSQSSEENPGVVSANSADPGVEMTEFLLPAFGDRTAMLIASALVGAAMHWRHETPKSPVEPIVADTVEILVDGVKTRRLS
jgi:hypothetical protein